MAIEVRIPTILRNLTGDAKVVKGSGDNINALIADLDSNHPGIAERLVEGGKLRRFINVYLNDEDVRFVGGLEAELSDGDKVTILPAVAGGSR
jgi:MoaD family protein